MDTGELIQTNNIISVINPHQDGSPKRLEVTTDGEVFVKAFRVNTTGDPVTIDTLVGAAATISSSASSDARSTTSARDR